MSDYHHDDDPDRPVDDDPDADEVWGDPNAHQPTEEQS